MFGGRYFAIRERLKAVVAGVERLASEQGVDCSDLHDDGGPSRHPSRPLRLAVAGEANAGKSSLLNALFGCDFCKADNLPTRGAIAWHGGVGEPREGYRWLSVPTRLSGNYEWIEPPGLRGLTPERRTMLDELCLGADVVLAVFHWSNPWEPSTWNFIAGLPDKLHDRTLVVLQQTDRGDPADLPVVLDHLGELSQRRIGRTFPVFAVSASKGQQAWTGGHTRPEPWQDSGLADLDHQIDDLVCSSPERFAGLKDWWQAAGGVVRRIEEQVDRRSRSIEDEAIFLGKIEAIVEQDRDAWIGELDDRIDGIDRSVRHIRGWISHRLGLLPSFVRCFSGDDTTRKLDAVVIDYCAPAWRLQAIADVNEMMGVCRGRWEQLVPRVREMLDVEMDPFDGTESRLVPAGERFVERFVDDSSALAGEIRPGAHLAEDLRRRQRVLGALSTGTLLVVTAAGVTGALGHSDWAWWILLAATVMLAGVIGFSWASRRSILTAVDDSLADSLLNLGARGRPSRVDAVRAFFAEFSRSLDVLRRRVAKSRSGLQPLLDRCSSLYLELQAVGHNLNSRDGIG